MGNLIKAEFRKILTTKVWWGLLIPTVLVAFFWALGAGAIATSIGDSVKQSDGFRELGISFTDLPLGVIALARSINLTVLFPMVFGVLAVASELERKTIGTTFLTAPNRTLALGAKVLTYAICGAAFGVIIAVMAALGTLATASSYYPTIGDTLLIVLAGVISSILWTLVGLGVGALLGSSVGSIVGLLIYVLVLSPILDNAIANYVTGSLPNGSANGLTSSTAANAIIAQAGDLAHAPLLQAISPDAYDIVVRAIRFVAGGPGALDWWASGLIFLGWTAIAAVGGLLRSNKRDIT